VIGTIFAGLSRADGKASYARGATFVELDQLIVQKGGKGQWHATS
jgi:hypothetical protein